MCPAEVNSMAYAKERGVPWHGLGTAVDNAMTSKELIIKAGLNTTVVKVPMYINLKDANIMRDADGGYMQDLEVFATVREGDGKILGRVTPNYEVFQNWEHTDFLDNLVQDGRLVYETAGSLFGGKRIWVLARLAEDMEVGVGDYVETYQQYMLMTSGHDGEHAIRITPTNVRVVCNNTLSAALTKRGTHFFSIKHNRNMRAKLADASAALQITTAASRRLAEYLERAAKHELNDLAVGAVKVDLFGEVTEADATYQRKAFDKIHEEEVALNGPNAYSMVQAITGFADHALRYNVGRGQKGTEAGKASRAERKLIGTVIGGRGVAFKSKGLQSLRELGVK